MYSTKEIIILMLSQMKHCPSWSCSTWLSLIHIRILYLCESAVCHEFAYLLIHAKRYCTFLHLSYAICLYKNTPFTYLIKSKLYIHASIWVNNHTILSELHKTASARAHTHRQQILPIKPPVTYASMCHHQGLRVGNVSGRVPTKCCFSL